MLTFDPVGGIPDHISKSPTDYHIIQFDGPIQDGWKAELHSRGVRLFGYVPDFASGFKYQPDVCQGHDRFNVWVLEDRQSVQDQLLALGAEVEPGLSMDHNIVFTSDPGILQQVADIPQVEFIEPMPEFYVTNNVAAGIVGAKGVWTSLKLDGTGETSTTGPQSSTGTELAPTTYWVTEPTWPGPFWAMGRGPRAHIRAWPITPLLLFKGWGTTGVTLGSILPRMYLCCSNRGMTTGPGSIQIPGALHPEVERGTMTLGRDMSTSSSGNIPI
jgi:hypothetical protein